MGWLSQGEWSAISHIGCGPKVFISWSGEQSRPGSLSPCTSGCHKAAQAANPSTSDKGNEAGALWDHILSSALEESNFGIVCLTARNLESRWLNFEAGALSKPVTQARVVPLLYGLTNNDLGLPLRPHQDEAG